jgi:hypothetical protein
VFTGPLKIILELFGERKKIKIIGNPALNKQLEVLAEELTKKVSAANKRPTQEIQMFANLKANS